MANKFSNWYLVEQVFTDLTNSKLKFEIGLKPIMSELAIAISLLLLNLNDVNVIPFSGLYPHAKFQVISFNSLKDILYSTQFFNMLKCCVHLVAS